MQACTQLSMWTSDPIIGAIATELMALSQAHGSPLPPSGVPAERPIPFQFPSLIGPDGQVDEEVEQFLRRLAIVFSAADMHLHWRRNVIIEVSAFEVQPDWLDTRDYVPFSVQWGQFRSEAIMRINAFTETALARWNDRRPASKAAGTTGTA